MLSPKLRKDPLAFQLCDSPISEPPSVGEGFDVLAAVAEGDWAGRFGFWVAIPSPELGDDPRGRGKCFRRMRVLLQRGLSFEFGQECVEGLDFGGREGDAGTLPGPAVARLDAVQDGAGGTGGNRRQLAQPPGVFQLAVLQVQSLLLQGAEEVFDMPARPIPANTRQAIAASSTRWVVKSRHATGPAPGGGSTSQTSTMRISRRLG